MKHLKSQGLLPIVVFSLFLVLTGHMLPVFAQVQTETYTSVNNPTNLIWTGKMFIFASPEDEVTKLYSVNPMDKSIVRFAATFAARGETHIAASSGIYFPSGYIYATNGANIQEITADGSTVRVFAAPSNGVDVVDIAFDNRQYWNNKLVAVTADGAVFTIDKDGSVEKVADLGADASPTAMTVARDEYGDFSGNILVAVENGDKLLAISNLDHSISEVATLPAGTAKQILYIQTRSDIYVANQNEGVITKIDRDVVKDHLAQIMVVSEAPDSFLSLIAVKSDRAGVQVATMANGLNPSIKGVTFVLDSELAQAIEGEPVEGVEINPLYIIVPIFAAVVVITVVIIWRYRGF